MNTWVQFLGPTSSPIAQWLDSMGVSIQYPTKSAWADHPNAVQKDQLHRLIMPNAIVISHGYRYVIPAETIKKIKDLGSKAYNCHISYLPWNRGADPNLWSWLDDTPKGVTIHEIDEGVDTGPIVAQRIVEWPQDQIFTLAETYNTLQANMLDLFIETWPKIIRCYPPHISTPQAGKGSIHQKADKDGAIAALLARNGGWKTPTDVLESYAAELQMSAQSRDMELQEI